MKATIEYVEKHEGFLIVWNEEIGENKYEYSVLLEGDVNKSNFLMHEREAFKAIEKLNKEIIKKSI